MPLLIPLRSSIQIFNCIINLCHTIPVTCIMTQGTGVMEYGDTFLGSSGNQNTSSYDYGMPVTWWYLFIAKDVEGRNQCIMYVGRGQQHLLLPFSSCEAFDFQHKCADTWFVFSSWHIVEVFCIYCQCYLEGLISKAGYQLVTYEKDKGFLYLWMKCPFKGSYPTLQTIIFSQVVRCNVGDYRFAITFVYSISKFL